MSLTVGASLIPIDMNAECFCTWAFPAKCQANCPYCFTFEQEERNWTNEEATECWNNFYDMHGSCYILATGREPTLELDLIAPILRNHYMLIQTNFGFDNEEFFAKVDPGRVHIDPTFHPIFWNYNVDQFVDKLIECRNRHYIIREIALVAWPEYLDKLEHFVETIENAGWSVHVVPCRSTTYQNRKLPEEYTEEELKIVNRFVRNTEYQENATFKYEKKELCAAGTKEYFCIMYDGTIYRCPQQHGNMNQNFFALKGKIELNESWMACDEEICKCSMLWGLQK